MSSGRRRHDALPKKKNVNTLKIRTQPTKLNYLFKKKKEKTNKKYIGPHLKNNQILTKNIISFFKKRSDSFFSVVHI